MSGRDCGEIVSGKHHEGVAVDMCAALADVCYGPEADIAFGGKADVPPTYRPVEFYPAHRNPFPWTGVRKIRP